MKKLVFFCAMGAAAFVSCARQADSPYEVIDESYTHPYGVSLPAADWSERGESGQVVTTLKNGVVITKTYADGVLEGETTYTYPHSDLIERVETFSEGKLVKAEQFYRNGTRSLQIVYQPSNTRQVFAWYDNASPQSSETFVNDLLIKGEYLNLGQQVDSRVDNSQGQRNRRDAFGSLIGVDTIDGGLVILTKTFYPNGAIRQMIPYLQGNIHGQAKMFLPGGEPLKFETWVNGQLTGITAFYENGEKVSEVPFVNGVKDGIEKRYRDGKIVVEEICWVKNQRHGPTTTTIGGVSKTDFYYHDKLVTKSAFEKMTSGAISVSTVH
jgi:antitoxin component YwqK of YwqJK toxin-antitoxin module